MKPNMKMTMNKEYVEDWQKDRVKADMVEFKAPVYAGDYIEAYGEITHVGNTSRKMKFEAYKVIRTLPEISASAAEVLEERILVCRATGTCVTPKECQRYNK